MSALPVCHPGVAYPGHVYWLAGWVNTATGHLTGLTQGFYIDKGVPRGVYTTTVIPGVRATFGVLVPTPGCRIAASTLVTAGSLAPAAAAILILAVFVTAIWLARRYRPRGKHHRGKVYALPVRAPWR